MTDYPPLWIMCRRLAPFVANGSIGFDEAFNTLMEHVLRHRWGEYGEQLNLTEVWIANLLAREAERAGRE